MKRTTLIIACTLLLLGRLWPAHGQEVHMEDTSPTEPTPDVYKQLPISEAERSTLRDAIKARNYARAEALLAGEVERQPKSPELLTMLGGVFRCRPLK